MSSYSFGIAVVGANSADRTAPFDFGRFLDFPPKIDIPGWPGLSVFVGCPSSASVHVPTTQVNANLQTTPAVRYWMAIP